MLKEAGAFFQGTVVAVKAKLFTKKNGSRCVVVRHEAISAPGIVLLEQYFDPIHDSRVVLEGDEVVKYPAFRPLEWIYLKCGHFDGKNGQIRILEWEVLETSCAE